MADENLFYWIAFNLLGQNFLACIDQVVIKLLGAALSNIFVVSMSPYSLIQYIMVVMDSCFLHDWFKVLLTSCITGGCDCRGFVITYAIISNFASEKPPENTSLTRHRWENIWRDAIFHNVLGHHKILKYRKQGNPHTCILQLPAMMVEGWHNSGSALQKDEAWMEKAI